MAASAKLADARLNMLRLLRSEVSDERVLQAMAAVPREAFVPEALRAHAYADRALPIGEGQTISQPLVVAIMLQALELRDSDSALEVGTGSGYVAALLARLCRSVVTVERKAALLDEARARLVASQAANVRCELAGAALGWPQSAPYDAILVSAGAPHVPRALLDQLTHGGRMVVPVGAQKSQELVRARKTVHGVTLERLGACAFVPLIGADAWQPSDDVSGRSKVR